MRGLLPSPPDPRPALDSRYAASPSAFFHIHITSSDPTHPPHPRHACPPFPPWPGWTWCPSSWRRTGASCSSSASSTPSSRGAGGARRPPHRALHRHGALGHQRTHQLGPRLRHAPPGVGQSRAGQGMIDDARGRLGLGRRAGRPHLFLSCPDPTEHTISHLRLSNHTSFISHETPSLPFPPACAGLARVPARTPPPGAPIGVAPPLEGLMRLAGWLAGSERCGGRCRRCRRVVQGILIP